MADINSSSGSASRQSSPASLSSAASGWSARSPPDEDVEVDVEQCSDGDADADAEDRAPPSPGALFWCVKLCKR
ncbi:hypothetical protein EVAR_27828_1 [Eumeta japonica]|uniref:Uncharacterized protein n=1 Tax=Eumeta variegata TaxID=151549 RepID=A0A4C1VJD1_EUMVA|nr:hypothetical protein EVAR_27828_1 [Eumeta japonica]